VAQSVLGSLIIAGPALSPTIQDRHSFSLGEMALVLGGFQGGLTLALLLWGMLADRVGERFVIAAGMTWAAVAMAVAAQTDSSAVFIGALVTAGIGSASVVAASGRAVMAWFGPSERGLALGIRQTSAMLGQGGAAAILPLIAAATDLRVAFATLVGAALAAAAVSIVWMREPRLPHVETSTLAALRSPFRDARIWRISLGGGFLVIAQHSLLGFVVLFLHHERGFSPGAAAGVLAAMTLSGAALRILVGYWSDRLAERLLPLRWVTMALAVALVLVTLATAGPDTLLVATLIVAGMLSVAWNGLAFTAVAELAGRDRSGAALGLQQTILGLMGAVTPVAYAAVVTTLSWRGAFGVLLLCPLLALPFLRDPAQPALAPGHEPAHQQAP
jgi:MFS family permease